MEFTQNRWSKWRGTSDEHRNTTRVPDSVITSVDEAVTMYEASGGNISQDSLFGVDPLSQHPQEQS